MSLSISLVKGFAGKPSHPPLTEFSVGAYTVGVAISGGLIVALPTALTGLLDYFDLPKRAAARTLATYHRFVMLAATALFTATWAAQRQGYLDGEITTIGLILGIAAFVALAVGGVLGGALAYVYGVRVIKQDVAIADALIPGRLEERATPDSAEGGRTDRAGSSVRGG